MSRIRRWDFGAPCPRWTNGTTTITHAELNALPHPDDEAFSECSGVVRVTGYYDPGNGHAGGYDAPEGENEIGPCPRCGTDEWTDAEIAQFEDASDA